MDKSTVLESRNKFDTFEYRFHRKNTKRLVFAGIPAFCMQYWNTPIVCFSIEIFDRFD